MDWDRLCKEYVMTIVKCADCKWQGQDDELMYEDDQFGNCPDCSSPSIYKPKLKHKFEKKHKMKAHEVIQMLED
jgi:DNA-directed RNA polymerase subunit RPC12/RpoP